MGPSRWTTVSVESPQVVGGQKKIDVTYRGDKQDRQDVSVFEERQPGDRYKRALHLNLDGEPVGKSKLKWETLHGWETNVVSKDVLTHSRGER